MKMTKFEAGPVYTLSSRLAWATQGTLVSKRENRRMDQVTKAVSLKGPLARALAIIL